MEAAATATMGHNRGPVITPEKDDLQAQIEADNRDLIARFDELMAVGKRIPARIEDDETQGKLGEWQKGATACLGDLEGRRAVTKRPWTALAAVVDGVFKNRQDPLAAMKKELAERGKTYTDAKEEKERIRLAKEAEERRAKAEADILSAARAEQDKKDADWRAMWARAEQEDAEWERDNAIRFRAEMEARARAAKEKAAREEAERKRQREERDRQEAKDAEERKQREAWDREDNMRAAAERENDRRDFEEDRERAFAEQENATFDRDAAEVAAKAHKATAKEHAGIERESLASASREERRATKLDERAEESGLGNVRSDHGALVGKTGHWDWELIDRNLVDKHALWPHLNGDAIEVALGKWMKAQPEDKRQMRGARIEFVEDGRTT